jgi:hypothetical protein
MLTELHSNRKVQLGIGFAMGIVFGFLLQKGGVTSYDVIVGQLLLKDFTVLKVMLTAVLVGSLGVHFLVSGKMARLHPKSGSVGQTVTGGLIFGVGFAILGYCPGTLAGAIGQGSLDALFGGLTGILLGAWLFSLCYPLVKEKFYPVHSFGDVTIPEIVKKEAWKVLTVMAAAIIMFLTVIELSGL